jgi:hypothetical protein
MTINVYSLTQLGVLDANGNPISRGPQTVQGQPLLRQFMSFAVPSTSAIGDIYRIFKNLDANVIPAYLTIGTYNALTSLAVSAGLYRPNLSTVTAPASGGASVLMAATSIATAALPQIGLGVNGLAALYATGGWEVGASGDNLAQGKMLYQIAGDSLINSGTAAPNLGTPRQYDLCLTVTTATAVAGYVGCELLYYLG